jgi:hypothetical protein
MPPCLGPSREPVEIPACPTLQNFGSYREDSGHSARLTDCCNKLLTCVLLI